MPNALTFAGGTYGLEMCTLGYFLGYGWLFRSIKMHYYFRIIRFQYFSWGRPAQSYYPLLQNFTMHSLWTQLCTLHNHIRFDASTSSEWLGAVIFEITQLNYHFQFRSCIWYFRSSTYNRAAWNWIRFGFISTGQSIWCFSLNPH